jgi:LPXTG-motif cell wall-anchored protein
VLPLAVTGVGDRTMVLGGVGLLGAAVALGALVRRRRVV